MNTVALYLGYTVMIAGGTWLLSVLTLATIDKACRAFGLVDDFVHYAFRRRADRD